MYKKMPVGRYRNKNVTGFYSPLVASLIIAVKDSVGIFRTVRTGISFLNLCS